MAIGEIKGRGSLFAGKMSLFSLKLNGGPPGGPRRLRVAVLLTLAAGRGRSGVRRGVARRVTPRGVVDVLVVLGEGVVRESKPGGTPSAGAPWPARVAPSGGHTSLPLRDFFQILH